MIRFLQKDSRLTKGIFVVIIAAAIITMVITLVPGIFPDSNAGTGGNYATVYGGSRLTRIFDSGVPVPAADVARMAERQLAQRRLPESVLPFVLQQVGQGMVQQAILLNESNRMGVRVTDQDLRQFLHSGQFGQVLFPNGKYVGDDKYTDFVQNYFGLSRRDFERELKKQLAIERLQMMVTGGITVSDREVRDAYRRDATKIRFAYAVLTPEDIGKSIHPGDEELEAFFKQNAMRYAHAIPEKRRIQFFSFTGSQLPGGAPQVSQQEIEQYYQAHQKDYQTPEQVRVRHILIQVPRGGDAKADAAARARAEDVLKQLKAGGSFAELARKYSDDPGSKTQGGELGMLQRGRTVPEFDKAAFALPVGQVSDLVKTQFGYHILEVEEKQPARTQPINEVLPSIQATLIREKEAQAENAYAQQLLAEARKDGLEKTAAAHHLTLSTSDYVDQSGMLPSLPDSTRLLAAAFAAKQGGAPESAPTGEGYAIFAVTGVQAAHAPSFEEYKAHVEQDYRAERVPQLLAEKTRQLAEKAHLENDLGKAARELGATLKTSDLVDQRAQVPEIGQLAQTAPALFDLKQGQISGPISAGQNGVVAQLLEVQEPAPQDVAKNLDQMREQLVGQKREQAFDVYVGALEQQYQKSGRIRLNPRALLSQQGQPS